MLNGIAFANACWAHPKAQLLFCPPSCAYHALQAVRWHP